MNTPDDSMTTREEREFDADRESRITDRIDEMLIDYDYLADAVIEPPVLTNIVATIKMVGDKSTPADERMARDIGMEAVIKAIKAALRPVAEAEIDAMPVTTLADAELNRADRMRGE